MLFHFLVELVFHDLHKTIVNGGGQLADAHFLNRGGLTLLGCVDPERDYPLFALQGGTMNLQRQEWAPHARKRLPNEMC